MVVTLLPDPSLVSVPGEEAGLIEGAGFLLARDGMVASFREPLPGAGPLRSGFTFSFSAEGGKEC